MAMIRRSLLLGVAAVVALPAARGQSQRRALAAGESLRGSFVQERHLKGFERPLRSTGDFLLSQGRGLIWRTQTPFPVVTVITPSGLVQQVDGRDIVRLPPSRVPALARLYDLFSASLAGDWSALNKDFAVTRGGDERAWTIGLKPKSDAAGLPIRSVELKGGAFLDAVRIDKPDGDWDMLSFSGQSILGTPLSAADAALLSQAGR